MGFRADASPACPHGRAGWRPIAGRIEVDRMPAVLFFDRRGSLCTVPQAVSADAGRGPPRRTPAVLRRSCGPTNPACCHDRAHAAADVCSSSRPSRAAASQSTDPRPRRPRSGSTPRDAVIADPAPLRSEPFWPALARQHTRLRRSARLPVIAPQVLSSNARSARSRLHARPRFKLNRSDRQRRTNFLNTHADAKSP